MGSRRCGRGGRLMALALGLLVAMPVGRAGAETLRVGKAVGAAFPFVFVDIGVRNGIFKKHGLDLEISAFGGGPRVMQAMAAGSIDIGLDSGSDLALSVKGAPVRAIASIAEAPLDLCVVVRPDLAAASGADLKGRRITTSSPFALTAWMVREMSRQQGWGPDGVELVTMLSAAAWPLLHTKEVDGISTDLGSGLMGEKHGAGRVLVRFNDVIRDFHVYHVSATDKIIETRPDLVKAFVAGWIESVAFARAHRENAIAVATQATGLDEDISRSLYDAMMPLVSADGRFNVKAIDALARSFVDLKLLDTRPDMTPFYSERFLPGG